MGLTYDIPTSAVQPPDLVVRVSMCRFRHRQQGPNQLGSIASMDSNTQKESPMPVLCAAGCGFFACVHFLLCLLCFLLNYRIGVLAA